jgi:hypothetical protein
MRRAAEQVGTPPGAATMELSTHHGAVMDIKLANASFFVSGNDHVFNFHVGDGLGMFVLPVVTANVEGLEAQYVRAHENLVTTLEMALDEARDALARQRRASERRGFRPDEEEADQG